MKPGFRPGSSGALRVAEAHRGPHEHDRRGGFAANPQLAKEAGHKGGEAVKRKYGAQFYRDIGKKGGETIKQERGTTFFKRIGRLGGKIRAENFRRKKQRAKDAKTAKAA